MKDDYEELHDSAEHDADKLERHSEELGEEIERTRDDWEAKKRDESVPGARPEDAEEERDRAEHDGPPKEAEITPGD